MGIPFKLLNTFTLNASSLPECFDGDQIEAVFNVQVSTRHMIGCFRILLRSATEGVN